MTEGRSKRRKYLLIAILIVGLALVTAIATATATMALTGTSTILADRVTNDATPMPYTTFTGIGGYFLNAQCTNVNATRICPVQVSISANRGLFVKWFKLEIVNSRGTTLAVEDDTFTSNQYGIVYGMDQPWTPFVTITLPSDSPGTTWTSFILVRNPPMVNSKMVLNVLGEAYFVENHYLGRSYDAYTGNMQVTETT